MKSVLTKRTAVVIFKIIIIIFMVVLLNLILMPKYINENPDGRIIAEYYDEDSPIDVLFLGSSTVYSGVSPCDLYDKYGFTSFVRASSSQTSWISYYVLKESLKTNIPKVVALDIGFLRENDDYAEEVSNRKVFDYMRNSSIKCEALSESMADIESKTDYFVPAFRYHSRWKDLSVDDFKYALYKPQVTHNGQIVSFITSEELPPRKSMEEIEDHPLTQRNRDYLNKILNLCREYNIELMLIKVPSYDDKWGPILEKDFEDFAVSNNITYINYNSLYEEFDWINESPDTGSHLNTKGAERFSDYLGKDIVDKYNLQSVKNDTVLNKIWEDKLSAYEKAKAEYK